MTIGHEGSLRQCSNSRWAMSSSSTSRLNCERVQRAVRKASKVSAAPAASHMHPLQSSCFPHAPQMTLEAPMQSTLESQEGPGLWGQLLSPSTLAPSWTASWRSDRSLRSG